ncbi:SAM-dependent DNA methyltransferase, partial [Burkholderia pseudomallei]
SRITVVALSRENLLNAKADCQVGIQLGDYERYGFYFWEIFDLGGQWIYQHTTVRESTLDSGCSGVLRWEGGHGSLASNPSARIQGTRAWGKQGVVVRLMGHLPVSRYLGFAYDNNVAVLVPNASELTTALWCYCESGEFASNVRQLEEKLNVTNATLGKVPFDVERWTTVAAERFPAGLPKPLCHDQNQWLFHGHPQSATDPLQVAVARLAGYRWPAETDSSMELADEARTWIAHCAKLTDHTDDDGIVCLSSVRGEPPAHERLLKLLIAAWETVRPGSWRPTVLEKLLADADCAGKGLEAWMRDKFFEQHAKRFQHRPFIWHVWDGLKDGFAALVNYHRLDAKNLERLIHTYLGDWIRQQEAGVRDGVDGAQTRLAAAQDLKRRLGLILEGEPPYDIFVRWKKLSEQPIGWNPDLNDGVRLNIRPFVTAEVLRHNKKPKLNISWEKDRGRDVESAPWYSVFKGERINDHHLTVAEKKAAREDQ